MNHPHVPAPELFQSHRVNRILLALLGFGGFCLAVVLITGFLLAPAGSELRRQFAFSWLFAFLYFFTILIGCLFWILVHHATDSGWGIVVRRQMENLAGLLPWTVLFFIPLVLSRFDIWDWLTAKQHLDANPALEDKIGYFDLHIGSLTLSFFWIRAVLYFLYFAGAAIYFRRTSVKQDSDGNPRWSIQMRGVSFVGIILFALGTTFMAFDWMASLEYKWASTMWGVYIFAGSAGAGIALIILVVLGLKNAGYLSFVNVEHYHMMGKLLFCFSIFWGYIGFSQYMLIWYGNIPEETVWFLRRNIGSWNTLSIALVVGRFFIPFLYLLFQYTKRAPGFLAFMCFWVLAMHLLDTFVTINPFLHPAGAQVSWLDFATLFAIGFPLAFLFLRSLGTASLFPARDPRLLESVNVMN
jgi:hypothetical protein